MGSKRTCRSSRGRPASRGPLHFHGVMAPGREEVASGQGLPQSSRVERPGGAPPNQGEARTESIQKEGERRPRQQRAPRPSAPGEDGAPAPPPQGVAPEVSGLRLPEVAAGSWQSTSRALLQGSLVLRSLVGQGPGGSYPAPPLRLPQGRMVTKVLVSGRAGGPALLRAQKP